MNRMEQAATNSSTAPLTLETPAAPLATVALVGVGLGAAALGWNVGYNLGGSLEDHESAAAAEIVDGASGDDLIATRRAAIAG